MNKFYEMNKFIDMGNKIINLKHIKGIHRGEYPDGKIFKSKMLYNIYIDYYRTGVECLYYDSDEKTRDKYYNKLKKELCD